MKIAEFILATFWGRVVLYFGIIALLWAVKLWG
jgi:hypothetical protein